MEGPESACLDPGSGHLFVSQVAGGPSEKNGKGRIAKLTLEGKVLAADWVTGLNAHKGLGCSGGTLWTADIDQIVGIDIASGKITQRVTVKGAKFLNDVSCGPDGSVYVSDMMANRIHRLKDGKLTTVAEGEKLEYPNGVLYENGSLVVGGWGKPAEDFTTEIPGRLYRLDLTTKKKTLITPKPTGNLDGVEGDGHGGYIVSDWLAGKVLHITKEGEVRLLKQFKQGTADHTYLPDRKAMILPHMLENRVEAYDLSGLVD
jgi:sugar lactone lactonase YvrE